MSSVTMTTAVVIVWIFVLFVIAKILKNFLRQKEIDWENFYVLALFAAFSVITIIMIIYTTSPNVDFPSRGGTAEFGQFGDMLGGILNPVFGFITIIILIRTLTHESEKAKYDRKNIETLNHERKLQKLRESLSEIKNTFEHWLQYDAMFHESDDEIDHRTNFLDYYFNKDDDRETKMRRANELVSMRDHISERYDNSKQLTDTEVDSIFQGKRINYWQLLKYKIEIKEIEKCFVLLISNEKSGIFRHRASLEYNHFMSNMVMKLLIQEAELDKTEETTKLLMQGYDRSSL